MKADKLYRIASFAISLMLCVLLSGCQYIFPKEEVLQAPPLLESKEIDYTTVEVQRGDIVESIRGVGRFESTRVADVYYANGGGRLKQVHVKVGDVVKKDDILLELDVGPLTYDLQRAKLRLEIEENNYEELRRRTSNRTMRKNAELELEAKRLDVQQLEEAIENSILRAPLDGSVVYLTNMNLGSQVDSYSTLVRVADQSEKMLIYHSDSNSSRFQIGMKVQVETLSDNIKCEGEVVSTPFDQQIFSQESQSSMVFIKIPDEVMKQTSIGEQASLTLVLSERKDTLKLPRSVVKSYMQRRFVRVLENGVKIEKDVVVGLETGAEAEILEGLKVGEKVIAN